ncbi:hypothetical protein BC829DRAFT_92059 [Chytridium lagenaria]|nr:hypothetical protein BC829DRAFT_92059 [Chytridium lagenaria]
MSAFVYVSFDDLPDSIGNLSKLTTFSVSGSALKRLPPSMGNLQNLNSLCISDCKLAGAIPSTLGLLKNLQHLSLSGNELTGSIPMSLLSLPSLETLVLSNNKWAEHFQMSKTLHRLIFSRTDSTLTFRKTCSMGQVSAGLASLPVRFIRTGQNCIEFVGPEADFKKHRKVYWLWNARAASDLPCKNSTGNACRSLARI